MQRGRDATLLYATLVLTGVTAFLSLSPVRQAMNDYFDPDAVSAGRGVMMVIGQNRPAEPSTVSNRHAPPGQ